MRKIYRGFLLFLNYCYFKYLWFKNGSSHKLKKLRNTLNGEDVYIVASGPSLATSDLSNLAGKNVVTLHYSYNVIEDIDVNSHYWVVAAESRMVDFGEVSRKKFNGSFWGPGSLIRRSYPFNFFSNDDIIIPPIFIMSGLFPKQYRGFLDCNLDGCVNKELSRKAPVGMSVLFIGIQVAYFLGAKNIILLGADFGAGEDGFYYNDSVRMVDREMLQGVDPYEERYRKHIRPALKWYSDFLSNEGVKLYNASTRTRDDITKRTSL